MPEGTGPACLPLPLLQVDWRDLPPAISVDGPFWRPLEGRGISQRAEKAIYVRRRWNSVAIFSQEIMFFAEVIFFEVLELTS